MIISEFYKVLVLDIDLFESRIIDERHFQDFEEASAFCGGLEDSQYTTMIVRM